MSDECPVKEVDVFNETDDDVVQRVLSVHPDRNPPVAMCRTIKRESSSEETDEEYSLEYVNKCVEKQKQFIKFGYDKLNVYEVYKMSYKELKKVLRLGKQNSTGTKDELRKRLLFFLTFWTYLVTLVLGATPTRERLQRLQRLKPTPLTTTASQT